MRFRGGGTNGRKRRDTQKMAGKNSMKSAKAREQSYSYEKKKGRKTGFMI